MTAYALTIFTGAFLLFQVQPHIGKYILPWFGGTPSVWTTCMLFFQALLVGGYAYVHLTSRYLRPKHQAALQLGLLALALASLPITPAASWQAPGSGDPTWHILALLTVTLGLPYFVLATTGPLIQQWRNQSYPGRSPYRFYALSNLGSLLALLTYPFLVEPAFSRQTQAQLWGAGLGLFALFCGYCAVRLYRMDPPALAPDTGPAAAAQPRPPMGDRLLWLALAATATVLLLAITNKLCLDLAVIPFLWVLPLSLYLLSFILCFDRPAWYTRGLFIPLLVVAGALSGELLLGESTLSFAKQVVAYSFVLFVGGMFCHGELYRLRPAARHLTAYYLTIALGGALGGLLVAVFAPLLFSTYLELHLGLWVLGLLVLILALRGQSWTLAWGAAAGTLLATLAVPLLRTRFAEGLQATVADGLGQVSRFYAEQWWYLSVLGVLAILCFGDLRRGLLRGWRPRAALFPALLVLGFGGLLWRDAMEPRPEEVWVARNYYGVLRVMESQPQNPASQAYLLQNGRITHGLQFSDPAKARWPTTYYGEKSGVGIAWRNLPRQYGRRIGLVGLGAGTLASFATRGDYLRFYEINPLVSELAQLWFSNLALSPARVELVMGDARLSLERELQGGTPQGFDLLVLDAFSSDAIPVHLLTQEAFAVYLRHLRANGIIAVHVSNTYVDLAPVVEQLAAKLGLSLAAVHDMGGKPWLFPSDWLLLSPDAESIRLAEIRQTPRDPVAARAELPVWSDDYTSLWPLLRWR